MSRRRANGPCCTTRSTERRPVRITLLLLLALVPFAAAAQELEVEDTIELSAPVLQTLSKLQDEWLVWNSAFLQADERAASAAVDDMLRKTSTVNAPWTVLEGNCKRWARVRAVSHLVETLRAALGEPPGEPLPRPEPEAEVEADPAEADADAD